MTGEDIIGRTLDALERLMKMFAYERILYLLCAVISFVLLIFCVFSLFQADQITTLQLSMIFGSSSLIAISAARASYFLNKSFELISKIIQHIVDDNRHV